MKKRKKVLFFFVVLLLLLPLSSLLAGGAEEDAAPAEEVTSVEEYVRPSGYGDLAQYDSMEEFEKATGKKLTSFGEAPELKELVAKGELDSVEKRLPPNPQIIVPVEEIGVYGGTVRTFTTRTNRTGDGSYLSGVEGLVRFSPDLKTALPNVAVGWQHSDDLKSLTLNLREGIKWSDGEPFTADDVMFCYEDFYTNTSLNPSVPSGLFFGGFRIQLMNIFFFSLVSKQ